MEQTEFEVAPDQLIKLANKEFGLEAKKEPIIYPIDGFDFSKLLKWVSNPRTLAFATLAASVAILITVQDSMIERPEGGRRPLCIRRLPAGDR